MERLLLECPVPSTDLSRHYKLSSRAVKSAEIQSKVATLLETEKLFHERQLRFHKLQLEKDSKDVSMIDRRVNQLTQLANYINKCYEHRIALLTELQQDSISKDYLAISPEFQREICCCFESIANDIRMREQRRQDLDCISKVSSIPSALNENARNLEMRLAYLHRFADSVCTVRNLFSALQRARI